MSMLITCYSDNWIFDRASTQLTSHLNISINNSTILSKWKSYWGGSFELNQLVDLNAIFVEHKKLVD